MQQPKQYVRVDEHGVMRVGATRVMLDGVIAAFEQGHSAETIREQYPSLSLEDVYGAIAFYLGNRQTVEEYLKRQDAEWAKWKAKIDESPNPVMQRLRAIRRAGVRGE
jgi:uncharacterized protein (DUF433 family)